MGFSLGGIGGAANQAWGGITTGGSDIGGGVQDIWRGRKKFGLPEDTFKTDFNTKYLDPSNIQWRKMWPFGGGKKDVPIAPNLIDEQLRAEIEKKRQAREKALEEAKLAEEGMRGRLLAVSGLATNAIDQQVAGIVKDTGIARGLERSVIGAQQAQAGMLRSGMTGQRIGTSRLGEIADITAARTSGMERKAAVSRQVSQTLQDIDTRRQELTAKMNEAELNALSAQDFQNRVQQERINFNQFLTDLQLSGSQEQALMGILGSLGTVGGLIAGTQLAKPSTTTDTQAMGTQS